MQIVGSINVNGSDVFTLLPPPNGNKDGDFLYVVLIGGNKTL
jgi:hypothetical protein